MLGKLLSPDPTKRLETMSAVLQELFFNNVDKSSGGDAEIVRRLDALREGQQEQKDALERIEQNTIEINKRTIDISTFQHESQLELLRSFVSLRRCIFSLHENECPTAFVIIAPLPEDVQSFFDGLVADAKDATGVTSLMDAASAAQEGVRDAQDAATAAKEKRGMDAVTKGSSAFKKLSGAWSCLTEAAKTVTDVADLGVDGCLSKAKAHIVAKVKEGMGGQTVHMHLLCERCFEPQGVHGEEGGCVWPVPIETPGETVPRFLPLARRGLKAAAAANGVAKIGRLFGLPVPAVPNEWLASANDMVGSLANQESSVADFACIDAVLTADDKAVLSVNGET